ncbi:MAG: HAD family hydrolase [Lachnospiraceae bacterium]|nr:HAD family hydrolase [Lachnospiraceae bacterium]
MAELKDFNKTKEYMVCVDSDGCAMDTMNIKHIRCFGPCMIKEWNLEKWQDEILKNWNKVNLYAITRGINRFKGLAVALLEVNVKYTKIEGIEEFSKWADEAPELSNRALEKLVGKHEIFAKALLWSKAVNREIEALPKEEIKPFKGVKEALSLIHESCNVAVVSSANPEAVKSEWERFGLLDYVDIVCAQDVGSKSYCINEILKKGYSPKKVLMCGDALGDVKAAESNGVLYYPIRVNHENESWAEITGEPFERFMDKDYEGSYQSDLIDQFMDNLR